MQPLPNIKDVMIQVKGAKYISTTDMFMGYSQCSIKEEDKEKTAFICHKGLFEY